MTYLIMHTEYGRNSEKNNREKNDVNVFKKHLN